MAHRFILVLKYFKLESDDKVKHYTLVIIRTYTCRYLKAKFFSNYKTFISITLILAKTLDQNT